MPGGGEGGVKAEALRWENRRLAKAKALLEEKLSHQQTRLAHVRAQPQYHAHQVCCV